MYKLYSNAEEYKNHNIKNLVARRSKYKKIFIILNLFSALLSLIATIITALLISKLLYSSFPDWFFYTTAGISAGISLISSLLSYFIVNDTINNISKKLIKIEVEDVLYKNKLIEKYKEDNADFSFYVSIAIILGVNIAKKEVEYV